MANRTWVVTTSGDRPLSDVEQELKGKGFTVRDVLQEIGCITGTCDDHTADRLRDVRGVTDVSPDEPIDIGPPGSIDTW